MMTILFCIWLVGIVVWITFTVSNPYGLVLAAPFWPIIPFVLLYWHFKHDRPWQKALNKHLEDPEKNPHPYELFK